MIAFGCVIGSEERYARYALSGIRQFAEPESVLVEKRGQDCIHRAYNDILAELRDLPELEAVVLLHEDVRITDASFGNRVRAELADPEVAVLGSVGTTGVGSIAWWEGDSQHGQVVWDWLDDPERAALLDPSRFVIGPGDTAECDAVDGLILVLSRWAARHLSFDEALGPSFHGYDVDICFQARAAGKKVMATPLPVVHCTTAPIRDRAAWISVHQAFACKWGL
jgi:hypothetical protein